MQISLIFGAWREIHFEGSVLVVSRGENTIGMLSLPSDAVMPFWLHATHTHDKSIDWIDSIDPSRRVVIYRPFPTISALMYNKGEGWGKGSSVAGGDNISATRKWLSTTDVVQ